MAIDHLAWCRVYIGDTEQMLTESEPKFLLVLAFRVPSFSLTLTPGAPPLMSGLDVVSGYLHK